MCGKNRVTRSSNNQAREAKKKGDLGENVADDDVAKHLVIVVGESKLLRNELVAVGEPTRAMILGDQAERGGPNSLADPGPLFVVGRRRREEDPDSDHRDLVRGEGVDEKRGVAIEFGPVGGPAFLDGAELGDHLLDKIGRPGWGEIVKVKAAGARPLGAQGANDGGKRGEHAQAIGVVDAG